MRSRLLRKLASGTGRLRERAVELRYGVHTAEHVYLEDLGLETTERVWHDASSWIALQNALERLDVGRDDVFADVGSGLGRGLVVAAGFPFRRVIGGEISAELNARAEANLERSRGRRRAGAVEFVTTDALDWQVPPDVTVVYMYCPFLGTVFERFADKLLDSVDRHPRPLRVVYNYPLEHIALLRTGRARVLDVAPGTWPAPKSSADRIVTYQLLPRDEARASELAGRFQAHVTEATWLGEYKPGFVLEKPARLGGVVVERPGRQY